MVLLHVGYRKLITKVPAYIKTYPYHHEKMFSINGMQPMAHGL